MTGQSCLGLQLPSPHSVATGVPRSCSVLCFHRLEEEAVRAALEGSLCKVDEAAPCLRATANEVGQRVIRQAMAHPPAAPSTRLPLP